MDGFDFSDILDEAVDRSGGQEVTGEMVISARRSLRLMTERWTAQGFNTWRVENMTVGSASRAQAEVQLPRHVDDIITASALRDSGSTVAMRRIGPSEYATLTDKDSVGEPSQWWLRRDTPPSLHIYPTGPSRIDLWYVRRPEEYNRFSDVTGDIPGRWLEATVLGLAYDLARKRPRTMEEGGGLAYDEPLIERLRVEYADALRTAMDADRHRTPYRYRIAR